MALSALDQRVTAAISGLELPFVLETLIMPFGCIHGYAGGIIGMPALWISATVALGMWESPGVGRMGFFFYMYTAATGQCISGTLKILLNRTRPGMDGASAAQPLPNRHWLPGSPAFIRQFPMEQLLPSPLVKIGGLQHGVTKGLNGSESGAFPSGDAMAGACFAALLAGFTPIGIWGGIFYAHLTMFARVFYWYHWAGDVIAGALTALAAAQLVLHFIGGGDYSAMGDCSIEAFGKVLPVFVGYMIALKLLAKALRPPPPEPKDV